LGISLRWGRRTTRAALPTLMTGWGPAASASMAGGGVTRHLISYAECKEEVDEAMSLIGLQTPAMTSISGSW
jgi:hypothetical protein